MNGDSMQGCECGPPPPGVPPQLWRDMWEQFKRRFGAGHLNSGFAQCDLDVLSPRRGPDGCADQKVYCRTPFGVTGAAIGAVAAGAIDTIEVTTVDEAILREMVFTGTAGSWTIVSMKVRAQEFLPNGEIPAEAFGLELKNYALPKGLYIKSSTPMTLQVRNILGTANAEVFRAAISGDELR